MSPYLLHHIGKEVFTNLCANICVQSRFFNRRLLSRLLVGQLTSFPVLSCCHRSRFSSLGWWKVPGSSFLYFSLLALVTPHQQLTLGTTTTCLALMTLGQHCLRENSYGTQRFLMYAWTPMANKWR